MEEPKLEHLYDMHADLEAPQVLAGTPLGVRQIFPVKGGWVEGSRIKGKILPGGGDWATVRSDGSPPTPWATTRRTMADAKTVAAMRARNGRFG